MQACQHSYHFECIFLGKKSGIREADEKRAGCGILAKKGRECAIRIPSSRPCFTRSRSSERRIIKKKVSRRIPLRHAIVTIYSINWSSILQLFLCSLSLVSCKFHLMEHVPDFQSIKRVSCWLAYKTVCHRKHQRSTIPLNEITHLCFSLRSSLNETSTKRRCITKISKRCSP